MCLIKTINSMETIKIEVTKGLLVSVIPHKTFDFVMSTGEVARGYGSTEQKVRDLNIKYHEDLIEGKHYLRGRDLLKDSNCGYFKKVQPNQILWTKQGVSRIGFFLTTDRARLFRDWAEDLTIQAQPQRGLIGDISNAVSTIPIATKVSIIKINQIMREVCKIEDKELRLSITEKLYATESKF